MAKAAEKNLQQNSETALVKSAQAGDQKALQELVKIYGETIYGFSFKVCGNSDDAEDTRQEAYLNIFKSLNSFNFKSNFSTWIYRIVSNSCMMKFRKEKRRRWESFEQLNDLDENVSDSFPKSMDTPVADVLSDELREQMNQAILDLPPIYRLTFILKDLEGLKIEEVAESLDISVTAAKARLRRARLFMRTRLKPYMET